LVKSAQIKLDAANKRSTLANETRQFFDKSFRYGETDLPTRLRIELEAVDANKQAVIAKINYAISVSNLRQALGLLPE
jgi:outer membrane protein TolC